MVTREEVIKLSKLSKLSFSEEDLKVVEENLNNIFKHLDRLNELDLKDVQPLYSVLEIENRFSKDIVKHELEKEVFLNNAPKHDDNFVSLPIVVGDSNE